MPDPIIIPCATEDDWHAVRAGPYVGASEAAALFGLHPYMTPRELWAKLQGNAPEKRDPPSEAMLAGICLEDGIGKLYQLTFAAQAGEKVVTPQEFYGHPNAAKIVVRHPTLPFQCTPDFVIVTKHGARLLQVKNVSEWKEKAWIGTAPREYRIQVQVEMLCTGMGSSTLAALVGGDRLFAFDENARREIQDALAREAKVMLDLPIEPLPSTDEEIKRAFPASVEGLSKELERPESFLEFVRLKAEIEQLEEQLEPLKAAVQNDIGPAEAFTVAGKKAGTWKTSVRNDPPREARSYPVRSLRIAAEFTKQAKAQLTPRHDFPLLAE